MVMTTAQEEQLLGQLCKGVSTDAAMESLGLTWLEVSRRLDCDPPFRLAYYLAQTVRDSFLQQMEAATPPE
jgi:hypothetical protein